MFEVLEYTKINGKKVPKNIVRKVKGKLPNFMTEPKKRCTFGEIYLEDECNSLRADQEKQPIL